tara:strand:- start:94 stop:891 length:798 start_codon:yes stop_codon:yes gene_type:complete
MPVIAVAAIPTVASFIARMGVTKAAKKYAPKLIKEAQKYIKKHNLTKKFPTLGKKTAESMKKTTKKMQVVKKKVNPRIPKKKKKDSFDEELKKKEGAKNFNKKNKDATNPRSPKNKKKTESGGLEVIKKKYNFDPKKLAAGKNDKKVNAPKKTTTKKVDDTKTVTNVNKSPKIAPNLKKAGKIGAGIILGGLAVDQASKVLSNMSKSKGSEPSTFGAAFKKARKEKGPNATFTFKGKQYSTVTMDQVKKAGFNTLREYLNAQKKK